MKKNIVIIILTILVLGLGGYLVYDKVIDKEETSIKEEIQKDSTNDVTIDQKDAVYFDEYLKAYFTDKRGAVVAFGRIHGFSCRIQPCNAGERSWRI